MRAALQVGYGGLDTSLRLDDVAAPCPGPDDVVVRVQGSTLNRKDLFALENLTGPGIRPRPPLPHINGTDAWGTVAAVGSAVRRWREGDRVVVYPGLYCGQCEWCLRGETSACECYGVIGEQCWGSHAEFVRVPARNLEEVPAGLEGDALACAGGSWLTAWRALVTVAGIRPGETVLVVGASGGVGTGAIRIAQLTGCRVLAVASDARKAQRSIDIGADATIDAQEPIAARARSLTRGRGVDVAIDCVGGATWRETIGALARLGRMAICGATAGDTPRISIREIYQQHRRILGAPLGTRSEFRTLVSLLASGRLQPVVHTTLGLDRIHDALRVLERREFFGKVALRIQASES